MEIEVSIILPCYNIGKYLKNCIDSIEKQTYKKFEAIFIDDGSTDDTVKKFYEYKPDSRFKLYSKKNEGSGFARNYGLDLAKGKYVYFMDPDDTITPLLLEDNMKYIRKNNSDLNIFGYQMVDTSTEKLKPVIPSVTGHIGTNEEIHNILSDTSNNINISTVWSKFYNYSFLIDNNIRFTNLPTGQDYEFNIHVFDCVKSVTVIPHSYYNYFVKRPGSVRTEYSQNQFKSEKVILNTLIDKVTKWDKHQEYKEIIDNYKIYIVFGELLNCKKTTHKSLSKLLKDDLYLEVIRKNSREIKSRMSKLKLFILKHYKVLSLIPTKYILMLFQ